MLNLLIELAVAIFYHETRTYDGEAMDLGWAWTSAVNKLKFRDLEEAYTFLKEILSDPEVADKVSFAGTQGDDLADLIGSLLIVHQDPFVDMIRQRIPDSDTIIETRKTEVEAEFAAQAH